MPSCSYKLIETQKRKKIMSKDELNTVELNKEDYAIELEDEQLEKVTGGDVTSANMPKRVSGGALGSTGLCGKPVTVGQCQYYDASSKRCNQCIGKPVESALTIEPGDFVQLALVDVQVPCNQAIFYQAGKPEDENK